MPDALIVSRCPQFQVIGCDDLAEVKPDEFVILIAQQCRQCGIAENKPVVLRNEHAIGKCFKEKLVGNQKTELFMEPALLCSKHKDVR